MTTILLDGDTVVYKFACGVQKDFDWGDGVSSQFADADQGCAFVNAFLAQLRVEFKTNYIVVALSDPEANWRRDILDSYKQNRADFVRPAIWSELREYLRYAYDVYQKPTLEGDDICGILATHPTIIKGDKVIVGIDKDLRTIPGRHYNPDTREHFTVTEAEADWYHMYQTLVGDRVDNYKGCPYVGPVKARKLLGEPGSESAWQLWNLALWTFKSRGLTEADALQQAQVARICRHTDYNFNLNRVIPWVPVQSSP